MTAAEAGDAEACRELVEAFLPAVVRTAHRFPSGVGVERQELVHEGVAGLLFAARRYDPTFNTPFWAYASFWVRKAMQELVAERSRPVALSDRAVRGLARIRAARSEHVQLHRADPTNADLSQATGFTPAQIESLQAIERTPRAMEEPLIARDEDMPSFGDTIIDAAAERAYEQVLDKMEIQAMRNLADQLDERERSVILAHYGLGQPAQTLNEIGSALGFTAERARQIESSALGKLRRALAESALPRDETI